MEIINDEIPKCRDKQKHEWDEKFAKRYCKRCDLRRENVGQVTKWRYFKENAVKCAGCGKDKTEQEEFGTTLSEEEE